MKATGHGAKRKELRVVDAPEPIAVLVDREGLGDVMLKAPFLRALRRAFPENAIWWIATHQTAMARELRHLFDPDIAQVIAHSGLEGRIGPPPHRLRDLPPFERVFDMRTRIATVAATRLGLAHHGFYCCLPGYVLCDGEPPEGRRRPRHIAERALSLVRCATGRPPDGSGRLQASAEAEAFAKKLLPDGPTYVGLAPGSRQARKNWPVERYWDVARALTARGATPVFLLGPKERIASTAIIEAAPGSIVIRADAHGNRRANGVDRLIAQGQRLSLLLANDSGVGHIVGAAGTPVLSLFGPTDPQRWRPVAPSGRVLSARQFGGRRDIRAIPGAAVTEAALAMLASGAPQPPPAI